MDADGWGADAPPISRSQIQKVDSAYKPTRVNMADLQSQNQGQSRFQAPAPSNGNPDVVRGAYQPIGKVDIAEIRRQAKESGNTQDDRPTIVKGAYEPVGKVDIAAIRARAQGPGGSPSSGLSPAATGASARSDEQEAPKPLAERSAAFQQSERLTSMPKPKVANKFGGASSFTGTKAPTPGGFGPKSVQSAAPVGTASKTFADEGGKTPAQLWAERKAKQGGGVTSPPSTAGLTSPVAAQTSGDGGWKSGYTGKSWAPVQTTRTGQSAASQPDQADEQAEEPASPSGGVSSIRDRFAGAAPMGAPSARAVPESAAPPPMDMGSKPNAGVRGVPMPGLPTRSVPDEQHVNVPPPPAMAPRPDEDEGEDEEEDIRPSSPIRVAMPVSRAPAPIEPAEEEPPALPAASIAAAASRAVPPEPEPQVQEDDPARGAGQAVAESNFGAGAAGADHGAEGGPRAIVQYDYEKAEDNEIELREGSFVTDIDMVDEDWWMGTNEHGERGLFPSNYVEVAEMDAEAAAPPPPPAPAAAEAAPPAAPAEPAGKGGATATAQYDYEAAEDNELSFPDGATIKDVVSAILHL